VIITTLTHVATDHYSRVVVNGVKEASDFGALRKPINWQDNGFVSDVTSKNIRCNQLETASQVSSVAAGGTVGFVSNPAPYHPGPLQFYMAKVPAGQSISSWDGSGSVWFKVYSKGPTFANGQMTWPTCAWLL